MSDLPEGFDDASTDMRREYLYRLRGDTLANMIAEEVGFDEPRGAQLNKRQKAEIVLAIKGDN